MKDNQKEKMDETQVSIDTTQLENEENNLERLPEELIQRLSTLYQTAKNADCMYIEFMDSINSVNRYLDSSPILPTVAFENFAKSVFEFTVGHAPNDDENGCLIEDIEKGYDEIENNWFKWKYLHDISVGNKVDRS